MTSSFLPRGSLLTTLAALVLCLAGCSLGPDYEAPAENETSMRTRGLAATFIRNSDGPLSSLLCDKAIFKLCEITSEWNIEPWWRKLNDGVLQTLIVDTLENNLEFEQLYARLEAAQADTMASRSEFWPAVIPFLQHSESKASAANAPGIPASARTNAFFSTGGLVSWEIDLLGRLRRTLEARKADQEAARVAALDLLRRIVADVVRHYIYARSLQIQKIQQSKIVTLERKRVNLYKTLFQVGTVSRNTFLNSKASLLQEKIALAQIKGSLEITINKLSLFAGTAPGYYNDLLANSWAELPHIDSPLLSSVPEQLLFSRPDVQHAEHALRSATASIGVALADFYPRLDLDGSAGYSVVSLADVGRTLGEVYSLVPRMRWVFYESGRIRSAVNRAKAATKETLAAFKLAVLKALEEASSSIEDLESKKVQLDLSQEQDKIWSRNLQQVSSEATVGQADQLSLTSAKIERAKALMQLKATEAEYQQALVTVVQSFGGGWSRAKKER
jgi:NodT family efflux transporter outer membrane factor (OMF) lipoprotein